MSKTNKVLKVASIVGAGALIIGATIGGAIMYNPVDIPTIKNNAFQKGVESVDVQAIFNQGVESVDVQDIFNQGVNSVDVEDIFNQGANSVEPKIEYVNKTVTDTELIKATCDRLLFEDIAECQTEVKAEDKALSLAWEELEKELSDDNFLEDELKDAGFIADEDEVSVKKLYKDFEDIEILKSDYDDSEYSFRLKAKIDDEEADKKVYLLFDIEVSDGEAEIVDVNEE